jgi:hypothetical protein
VLKNQDQPEQNTYAPPLSSADRERVTAEEFSAALSTLEQRKAAEAAHLADTVEIGPTCRELGIDAVPEDIFREVQAQRAGKAGVEIPQTPLPQQPAKSQMREERERAAAEAKARLVSAASEAVKGLAAAAVVAQSHLEEAANDYRQRSANGNTNSSVQQSALRQARRAQRDAMRQARWEARRLRRRGGLGGMIGFTVVACVMWWAIQGGMSSFPIQILPPNPHTVQVQVGNQNIGVGSAGVSIQTITPDYDMTLGTMQDAQTVYASTDTLQRILKNGGAIVAQTKSLPVNSSEFANSWPLIMHEGKLYVQGYTRKQALESLQNGSQTLYNDLDVGPFQDEPMSRVVVPLRDAKLGAYSSLSEYSSVTFDSLKSDGFTQDDE